MAGNHLILNVVFDNPVKVTLELVWGAASTGCVVPAAEFGGAGLSDCCVFNISTVTLHPAPLTHLTELTKAEDIWCKNKGGQEDECFLCLLQSNWSLKAAVKSYIYTISAQESMILSSLLVLYEVKRDPDHVLWCYVQQWKKRSLNSTFILYFYQKRSINVTWVISILTYIITMMVRCYAPLRTFSFDFTSLPGTTQREQSALAEVDREELSTLPPFSLHLHCLTHLETNPFIEKKAAIFD